MLFFWSREVSHAEPATLAINITNPWIIASVFFMPVKIPVLGVRREFMFSRRQMPGTRLTPYARVLVAGPEQGRTPGVLFARGVQRTECRIQNVGRLLMEICVTWGEHCVGEMPSRPSVSLRVKTPYALRFTHYARLARYMALSVQRPPFVIARSRTTKQSRQTPSGREYAIRCEYCGTVPRP